MPARYILRFDDICATMNWHAWEPVEQALIRHRILPIVAVIPDNQDWTLQVAPPNANFWSVVRGWQARGWTIGWHGYRHKYETSEGGLLGIHRGSEFAGLPEEVQREKLRAAHQVFRQNGVAPEVWVAPGHSFDMTTVSLLPEFGIRLISDGFSWRANHEAGCTWIPQQLWQFRSMPLGTWTICLHINNWSAADVGTFELNLERFAPAIAPVASVLRRPTPRRNVFDRLFGSAFRYAILMRQHRSAGVAD